MTNTGDFRRYSIDSDMNILNDSIDRYFNVSRSSAAPKYVPETEPGATILPHQTGKRKSRKQILQEQRETRKRAAAIVLTSVLVIAMMMGAIGTLSKKNQLIREISSIKSDLTISQSENVRLNSQLNSLVSMNMIDKYAVENLGMSKVTNSQIRYIDVSQYKEEREAAALRILKEAE
ncbi:MAG: hypothetical protein NC213_07570 [Acetobacter sp.]|nr:hypothetical protein [Bacteroides sp.]MCM1341588.1 hypothetical protein [Acetobacter sp.]MCM1433665.1 hypothetical protein [Clostridiales bacterium]